MEESRTCTKCGEHKTAEFFTKDKKKDRLYPQCKLCKNIAYSEKYKNSEAFKKRRAEYSARPERLEWARNHAAKKCLDSEYREAKNKRKREWYRANDGAALARKERSKPEVKEKISKQRSENYKRKKDQPWYIEKARERLNEYRKTEGYKSYKKRQHQKYKQNETVEQRLILNQCKRMRRVLKKETKSIGTKGLLACDSETLRKHIESQFKEDMRWDNYSNSGWHIDHILPCKTFDLSKPEEQKICFHYLNLQPLWRSENCSKRHILPDNHIEVRKKIEAAINAASI